MVPEKSHWPFDSGAGTKGAQGSDRSLELERGESPSGGADGASPADAPRPPDRRRQGPHQEEGTELAVGSSGVPYRSSQDPAEENEDAIEPASAQQGRAHLGVVEIMEVAVERSDRERVAVLDRETPEEVRCP